MIPVSSKIGNVFKNNETSNQYESEYRVVFHSIF